MGITEENQEELNGFQLYLDELEGITSCSEAENTELAKEAANGSAEAKKRLIEGNLKNALAMIREYLNKGLPAGEHGPGDGSGRIRNRRVCSGF